MVAPGERPGMLGVPAQQLFGKQVGVQVYLSKNFGEANAQPELAI
jgi:hypothetical protein